MSSNKSFSTETSERYSRALFEVSNESDEVKKVEDDIKNFNTLYNSSSEIKKLNISRSEFIQLAITDSKLGFQPEALAIRNVTSNVGYTSPDPKKRLGVKFPGCMFFREHRHSCL